MDKNIKVFVKNEKGTFRRILNSSQYIYNNYGQIVLPKDHYSRGYVERIVVGTKWENFPLYQEEEHNLQEEINNDIDFLLDNQ